MGPQLERAIAWIDERIENFHLDPPATPDNEFLGSLKAVCELGHAGDALQKTAPTTGERWLEIAWNQIDGGAVIAGLVERNPMFALAAVGFLPFALAGRRCEALEQAIADQVPGATLGALGWTLMIPTLEILGLEVPDGAVAQARPTSVLANQPRADRLTRDASYLFAHECLYATRWGRRPDAFGPTTASYVEATLRSLADRTDDPDLLAELALAYHGLDAGCVEARVWEALASAQTIDGNVIPTPLGESDHRRLPHPRFERTYHTTIAAIMAWATCDHWR